jgi:hypothetical protein
MFAMPRVYPNFGRFGSQRFACGGKNGGGAVCDLAGSNASEFVKNFTSRRNTSIVYDILREKGPGFFGRPPSDARGKFRRCARAPRVPPEHRRPMKYDIS